MTPETDRRRFMRTMAGAAAGLAALADADRAKPQAQRKPPNLLIIHTDQLSQWALSIYAPNLTETPNYGATLVETPHIDRIGREGVVLTNFFTNSAVCTPSRGCLFTGRYPHSHGAYRNNIELGRDEVTIAHVLRDNGYDTGYSGKWHLDGPPKPGFMSPDRAMGFDDCTYMFNRGHWKKMWDNDLGKPELTGHYKEIGDEETYMTDFLATKTIEFATRRRANPFFYVVSFPDPHGPLTVREPYMSMYDPEQMPVPNTFTPPKGEQDPDQAKATMKQRKAHYCGLVKCIDDNVKRILDALEASGILDDTIIVFTTDHGDYMGEHGLYGKNQWYRTAYQLPFLVRWPRQIPPDTVLDRFVTNVDVQQTLLGLMGIEPCGREQGRDASGLLRGKRRKWEDVAWIHHSSLKGAGIFTPRRELVLRSNGDHMLFDRIADPEQTNNLAGDRAHRSALKKLAGRVLRHHRALDSPAMEWLQAAVSAAGRTQ